MDVVTKKRKAENCQLKDRGSKLAGWSLKGGHSEITNGNIPDALCIEPKGEQGALLVRIHQLQMDLIGDARAGSSNAVTDMKNKLAESKLLDELEVKSYEAYENGLRSLRDELRVAQSKRIAKLLADIGCDYWFALYRLVKEASAEAIQESVKNFERKHNVFIIDVHHIFTELDERKRPFSRRDSVGSNSAGPIAKKSRQGPRDEQGEDSNPKDKGKPEGEGDHGGESEQKKEGEQEVESFEQNVKNAQMAGTNAEINTTAPISNAPTSTIMSAATVSDSDSDSSDYFVVDGRTGVGIRSTAQDDDGDGV